MIKLENYEVLGWEHAIRGMRNPMNSWEKSDTYFGSLTEADGMLYKQFDTQEHTNWMTVGENDHDLMMRLASAGPVHGKFRRMITVYVDITAPLYWWKEFDTYKVGTVANSCSTMHKIHAKEFTIDDFSHEHLFNWDDQEDNMVVGADGIFLSSEEILDAYVITILNASRDAYLKTKKKVKNANDSDEAKRLEALAKKYWWQMIQLLPSSYNQKRAVQLNYEVLANMYQYRKAHKLDEWVEFCKWVETLPYSEIITCETRIPDEGKPVKFSGPNGVVRPDEDIKKHGNSLRGVE